MVLTHALQATPEYLTEALLRGGALTAGRVARVDAQAGEGAWSTSAHLRLEYSNDAQGKLPTALFLKMCQGTFGRSEIDYLTRDYVHVVDAPLPRCYDAQIDDTVPAYHLLMDDLGESHENNWQRPPTRAYAEALAEALAVLHAPFWHLNQRAALGIAENSLAQFERYLEHCAQGLDHLLAATQDDITDAQRDVVKRVFKNHPEVIRFRLQDTRGLTLLHGDLNPGNILSPKTGERPVYLIDRQPFDWSLITWYGVADLAYASVHWWPTEQRRAFEQPMLQQYHTALQQRGIVDYPWELLWNDFRLMAMFSFYVAVEWCVLPEDRTNMRWVWLPQLEKSLAAFRDLRCEHVL